MNTCYKEFVANDIINCEKCHKVFIECECKFPNALPSKGLVFPCKNANCKYKTAHRNCGSDTVFKRM